MIAITNEMRQNSELKRLETETDKVIDPYFYPLKELYEKAGYRIVPVGIIGGVMQRDYFIIW